MRRSITSRLIEQVFVCSGRQKKFSDSDRFEKHLNMMSDENKRPYIMPWANKFCAPVEKIVVGGNDCYVINKGKEKAVMYLHGGSCIHQMLYFHFRFLNKLVKKADVTIYALIYPLAPDHVFTETYDMMSATYDIIRKEHDPKHVTVMGDSIGGNLALGFAQTLIDTDRGQPGSIILLSPWLDMTGEHPDTNEYYKREPRLALNELKRCGDIWSAGVDKHDPRLSPIFGPIKGLGSISVYVGTHELLLLDSERLRDRAEKEGVAIAYHEYDGLTHVFPLHPIPEAKKAFAEIVSELA